MTIANRAATARWVKAGASEADERLLRPLGPLLAAMFLGFLTVSVPLPVLPLHVHGTLGFGTAVAGLSVGIQSFATILTRPYAGRMVDRRGAKSTLMRGLAISAGAGLAYLASVSFALSPVVSLLAQFAGICSTWVECGLPA
jgi:MFS family permease